MESKRFLIVPEDSSAARMPRPGATMASATLLSSARDIRSLRHVEFDPDFAASFRRWQRADGATLNIHSRRGLFRPQYLDPRQRLALEPFKERAAGGRDIAEPLGHARSVERGDRVAAPRNRYKLPGAREFRRRLG